MVATMRNMSHRENRRNFELQLQTVKASIEVKDGSKFVPDDAIREFA